MKSRLGECLLEAGKISRFELDTALNMQRDQGQSLGEILVSLNVLTEDDLVEFLSSQLNIPIAALEQAQFDPMAIDAFSEGRARKHMCLPIRFVGDTVEVAMHDPLDLDALEEVAKSTGRKVRVQLSTRSGLLAAIEEQYMLQSHRFAREAQMEKRLLQRIQESGHEGSTARTFAVLSNKGGVGKTHLSVNLALAFAQLGHKTLLIDADLGTANCGTKLGYQPKITLKQLFTDERPIEDIVVSTPFDFDFIAGQPGEYKLANMSVEHRLRFISEFIKISRQYEVAIFDLSAGIETTVLDFALAAHEALVITTPQDIVAGYSCVKALFYRFMEQEKQLTNSVTEYITRRNFEPRIVVNQVDSDIVGDKVFEKVKATAHKHLRVRGDAFKVALAYAGYILYDHKGMRDAEMQRKPYLAQFPHTPTAQCYMHLANELVKPDTLRSTEVEFRPWYERTFGLLRGRQA